MADSLLADGIVYLDGPHRAASIEELQRVFASAGSSEVWTWVGSERHRSRAHELDTSLDAALGRARLAKAVGLPFNPMLLLARNYGDMAGQPAPRLIDYPEIDPGEPWHALGIERMATCLERYAAIVARSILDSGATVNIWDLGNEVDLGVAGVAPRPGRLMEHWRRFEGGAWYEPPDTVDPEIGRFDLSAFGILDGRGGRGAMGELIGWLELHVWPHTARLLAAAAAGIRSIDPGARFSSHVGFQPPISGFARAFWRAMWKRGFRVDEIGLSIYPTINPCADDDFRSQKREMLALSDEFGVPVMITEYAYPAGELAGGDFARWNHPVSGYPLSDDGQAAFHSDLVEWARSNGLAGLRPFGAEYATPGWEQMSLFRRHGRQAVARPALRAFAA